MPKKDKLRSYLQESLESPHLETAIDLYEEYYIEFRTAPCSKRYHGAYQGALYEHTYYVMRLTDVMYDVLDDETFKLCNHHLDFTKQEAIFTAFLHDFAKPLQQRLKGQEFEWHYNLIFNYIERHGFKRIMTEQMNNALLMHHGGFGPKGKMLPMAILLHSADMWASQVIEDHFFDKN